MRRFWILAFILLVLASCSKGSKEVSSAELKDITPKGNHNLLIVESESCIYCKQLEKDMQRDERIKTALSGINVYKLNYDSNAKVRYKLEGKEGTAEENDLARMLGVNSFPYLIFYDKEGKVILSIPGYVEPKTFACLLDYIKKDRYQDTKLQEYLKRECT